MADNFAFYLYVDELPQLTQAVHREESELRKTHPGLADRLVEAWGNLLRDLDYLAAVTSGAGTLKLVEEEQATRVRPDTHGGGGPRLSDYLQCDPIPALPGSVGIANEDILDDGVEWWWTNEIGSDVRVGGQLFGKFFDSDFKSGAVPNSAEFRVHPLFQASIEDGSGPGIISKPIPARRFVFKSIPEIEKVWKRQFDAAKQKFNDALLEITATARAELDERKA